MTGARLVDVPVVGTVAEVTELIRRRGAAGDLVSMTAPVPVGAGRVSLTVRTRGAAEPTPGRRPARRVLVAAGVTAGMAAVGAAGWAVYLAVLWVAAHWALICGALVVALALLGLIGRAAAGGRHCPGC